MSRAASKNRMSPVRRQITVQVTGREEPLRLSVAVKIPVFDLLSLVCTSLGIHETWFFGLHFLDPEGERAWLSVEKKLNDYTSPHHVPMEKIEFRAQFFPEKHSDVIQDTTLHYILATVHDGVLRGTLLCPTTIAVEMAALIMLTRSPWGATSDQIVAVQNSLLPVTMCTSANLSLLEEYYNANIGLTPAEAEQLCLKKAETLKMYGCTYFSVTNRKGLELNIAVHPRGISVFASTREKLEPTISYSWSDIRTVSYKERKFSIVLQPLSSRTRGNSYTTHDTHYTTAFSITPSDLILSDAEECHLMLFTTTKQGSRLLLVCCGGNHELYKRRRQLEPVELQQLRVFCEKDRNRSRDIIQHIFTERHHRLEAEQALHDKDDVISKLHQQLASTRDALQNMQTAAQMMEANLALAKEEARLLTLRNNQLEYSSEIQSSQRSTRQSTPAGLERRNEYGNMGNYYVTPLNDTSSGGCSVLLEPPTPNLTRRLGNPKISNSFQELSSISTPPKKLIFPQSSFHGPLPSRPAAPPPAIIAAVTESQSRSRHSSPTNQNPGRFHETRNQSQPPPIIREPSPTRTQILPNKYPQLTPASRVYLQNHAEMLAKATLFDAHAGNVQSQVKKVWAARRTASLDRIMTNRDEDDEPPVTTSSSNQNTARQSRSRDSNRRSQSLLSAGKSRSPDTSYQL